LPKSDSFQNKGSMEIATAPQIIKQVLLGNHVAKSMGTGGVVSNTTGSNLVDREFLAELLMEAMPVPQVVDRVRIIPTKSGDVEIPVLTQTDGSGKFGGLTFSRIQEGQAKPDTNATWTKVRIQTNELAGSMQVSERLLSRSMINVEQLLIELSKSNLRYLLDTEILTGQGILECVGVINDAIRHVARNAVGTVSWADLLALKYAIPPEDRARGFFVINDGVAYTLEGTTDLYGRPLFTSSVANGIFDRLVSYPYATTVNSPALGAEGDVIFGDWSSYVLAMEEEIVIGRSSDYAFVNNLMTYKAFFVAGGRPVLPRKFATLTVSAS
jgi:HK97 family phage major capsid protein